MKILGIDPSSTCTGAALLEADADGIRYVDGWLLKPSTPAKWKREAKGCIPDSPAVLAMLAQPSLPRIFELAWEVRDLIRKERPDWIGVEVTSGKAHKGQARAAAGSLGIMGMAMGAVWVAAEREAPTRVLTVNERTHTRQGQSKAVRQAAVMMRYSRYEAAQDPGGDVSDAVSVAEWVAGRVDLFADAVGREAQ